MVQSPTVMVTRLARGGATLSMQPFSISVPILQSNFCPSTVIAAEFEDEHLYGSKP
jgi:hypothetical protein